MLNSAEELEALPARSVIKNRNGWVMVKSKPGWWSFNGILYVARQVTLPATLLISNTISQEKFREAWQQLATTFHQTGLLNSLEDVLETLGIKVSDE